MNIDHADIGQKTTASVLAHNSWPTLRHVLASLDDQQLLPGRVVVVDNASSDGTIDRLRQFRSVEAVSLPENVGVGAGHNSGIARALERSSCQLVWLLEHDSIPSADCLAKLIHAYEILRCSDSSPGALLPRIASNHDDVLEPRGSQPYPALHFTFNGALIPRTTFEAIGYLRADFFVGLEDTEFHRRMESVGMPVLTVPDALLVHRNKGARRRGSLPSVLRSYYSTRNSVFLDCVAGGRKMAIIEYLARAGAGALRSIAREPEKIARVAARVTGTFDGLTSRMGQRDYWFLDSPD